MYNSLVTPSFPPSILSIYHDTDSLVNFNSLLLCNIENYTHAQIRKVQNHHNPRHRRRRRRPHITRSLKRFIYIYIDIKRLTEKETEKELFDNL